MMRPIAICILTLALVAGRVCADETPSLLPAQSPAGTPPPKEPASTTPTLPAAKTDGGTAATAERTPPVPVAVFPNPLENIFFANPFDLGGNWRYPPPNYLNPLEGGHDPDSLAFRLGGFGVTHSGSPVKTGEYQRLQSWPFGDIDGLRTDGTRTFNFFGTAFDSQDQQAELQYYGPAIRAIFGFQQFPHQLDHRPINNFNLIPNDQAQDLNVGEDYAIRVEEFKGDVSANLTENIKLRVQAWGMRKFGDRQAEAMTHCFQAQAGGTRSCHVLSQSQHIDWFTAEVTPRLEARFGPVTIEYSRLMRQFSQNDQLVTRTYNGFSPILMGEFPYAIVPESLTQMDQLRIGIDLANHTRLYAFGYIGDTNDHFRHTRRDYDGYDVRLTDSTIRGLSLTAYAKGYHQSGMLPPTLLPDETQGLTDQQIQNELRHPIDFNQTTVGMRGSWRPAWFDPSLCRLTFTGGYEFDVLNREYAVYQQGDVLNNIIANIQFDEPRTQTQTVHVGAQQVWNTCLDTFARYKVEFVKNPLYGFSETSAVVNTSLPKQRHIVEVGGGWFPCHNFGISTQEEIDLAWHFADISAVPGNLIHFNEESYSTVATVWYAPTQQLSLTGSVAFLSNWLEQNITLGDDYITPGMPAGSLTPPETRRWNYGGTANIFSCRANYRLREDISLFAGYEYSRGNDRFGNRGFADLWPDLPQYSTVLVVTQRINTGIDWRPTELLTVYFRYIFFDYDDKSPGYNRGQAHIFLAGLSMIF
jgi:hypothetical protein